ncbi:uncharacterized protein LOC120520532, partial [Polypterus senegalus]|uniref:uncharacterized protein LOC120520532 n=1 Tax=Polypterus senegalus TaxID=55291 RepID=UPI001964AFC0
KFHHEVLVLKAPKSCGYHLMKKPHGILFESPYQACHVQTVNHYYTLTVLYKPTPGPQIVVNMKCPRSYLPIPHSTAIKPSTPRPPRIACRASSMSIELSSHLLDEVKVLDKAHHPVVIMNAPKECQYHLEKKGKTIVFTAGYRSCHVRSENSNYVLVVLYTPENGGQERVTMKCPIHSVPTSSPATSRAPVLYSTTCEASGMTLMLPGGSFNQIKLIDKSNRMVPVMDLPRDCGYSLLKAGGHLLLTVGYKACDIRIQDHHYTLTVIYRSATGDQRIHMKCPVQQASTVLPTLPTVHPHPTCTASGMTVVLPSGSLDQVKIIDQLGHETAVSKAPKHCGYKLVKGKGTITFSASYRACGIKVENHHYVLHLSYKPAIGNAMTVTLSCPVGEDPLKTTTPATSTRRPLHTECMTSSMAVVLPVSSPNDVYVVDGSGHDVHVFSAPKTCGYALEEKGEMLVLTAPYKACHVAVQHGHYVLEVRYKSGREKAHSLIMKCPVPRVTPPTVASSTHAPPVVSCKPASMSVVLPVEFPEQVTIVGLHGEETGLSFAPKQCGYTVVKSMRKISLTALYTSCGVHKVENFFVLNLRYYPTVGRPVAVEMKCPAIHVDPIPSRPSPTVSADPRVVCQHDSMSVELPNGKLEDIKLMDKSHHIVVVLHAPKECQYHLVKRSKSIVFTAGYRSCHVHTESSNYVLVVFYTPANGVQKRVTMKCPRHAVLTSSPATSRPPVLYSTTCEASGMTLMLPSGSLNQIKLIDKSNRMVPVMDLPRDCGYSLLKAGGHLLLTVGYKACDIRIQDHHYTLTVIYRSATGDRRVHMKCPVQQASTVLPTLPTVHPHPTCTASGMTVVLPSGSLDQVKIIDQLGHETAVSKAPKHCGYKLVKGKGTITFSASYRACGIKVENHHYVLHLSYKPAIGNAMTVTLSCPVGEDPLKTTTPVTSTRRPLHTACMTSSMAVVLPVSSPNDVYVVDGSGHDVRVISAPKTCGYALEEKGEMLVLTAPYKACHVAVQHGHYVLEVRYKSGREKAHSLTMKCPVPRVPPPTVVSSTHSPPVVSCHPSSMTVVLPVAFSEQVTILGLHGEEKGLSFAPKECGYTVVKSMGKISLTVLFTSCGVHKVEKFFVLNLRYYPTVGHPVSVQMKCPAIHVHPTPSRPSPTVSADPRVVCQHDSMSVELPNGKLEDIKLMDEAHQLVVVLHAPKECQYHLVKRSKSIVFTAGYRSCHVHTERSNYVLVVFYTPENGLQKRVTMKCPIHAVATSPPATSRPPVLYSTTCKASGMTLMLPGGSLNQIKLIDKSNRMVPVMDLPRDCGYSLLKAGGHLLLTVGYKACDIRIQDHHYTLTVIYWSATGDRRIHMKCPVQQASTVLPTLPTVHPHPTCTASGMTVVLPYGSLDEVKIIDQLGQVIVISKAPKHCGYKLVKGKGTITFSASYRACGIKVENHHYVLHLSYKPAIGNAMTVTLSCPVGEDPLKTTTPATSTRRPSHTECMATSMAVVLPVRSPNDVYIVDGSGHDVRVISTPKTCGYALEEKEEMLVLMAPYKACHVTVQHGHYVLEVRYKSGREKPHSLTMKCPVPRVPPPTVTSSTHSPPIVSCKPSSMTVVLPVEFPEQVTILGLHGEEKVLSFAPKECGYTVVKSMRKISFTALFTSCGVHKVEKFFVLNLRFYPTVGSPVAMQMKCPAIHVHPTSPRPSPTVSADPRVVCQHDSMSVELPNGKLEDIQLMDKAHHLVVVLHAPEECQYHLVKRGKSIVFTAGYRSCHVHTESSNYVLVVLYTPENGLQKRVTMKCPIHSVPTSSPATSRPPVLYTTTCEASGMTLRLPGGSLDQVNIMDKSNRMVTVVELPKDCGYSLLETDGHLWFTVGYKACDVQMQDNNYTLTVIYLSATGDRIVHMRCPVQQASTVLPTMPTVHPHPVCTASGMTVILPYGSLDQIKIIDQLGQEIDVSKAPKHCGYKLVKGKGTVTFSASYGACGIKVENRHYILHLRYKPAIGNVRTVTLSCPVGGHPLKTTTPATSTRKPSHTECRSSSMAVVLPGGSPNDVYIVDGRGQDVHVISAPKTCGYELEEEDEMLVLTALYKACHVVIQHGHYVLEVRYKSGREKSHSLTMKCPVPRIPPPTLATPTHSPSIVSCRPSSMSVVLPVEFPEQVTILGLHGEEKGLSFAPTECGYTVVNSMGKITLTVLYTSCGVHKEENFFVLNLHYYPTVGLPVAVQMKCPVIHVHPTPPRPSPPVFGDPRVVCQLDSMSVELPYGKMEDLKLKDKMGKMVPVYLTSKRCGYRIVKAETISLLIPYKACDVKIMDHHYSLLVAYTPNNGVPRQITVKCPVIGKPPSPLEAGVSCHEDCMSIDLPTGPLDQVKVVDEHHNAVTIKQSVQCGYNLSSGVGKLHFSAYYKACHVKIQNGHHVLTVLYTTSLGTHGEVQLKCPVHDLVFHQGCDLPKKKQVQCGPAGVAPSVCRSKGCCADPQTAHCFYPMDTCTADGHFVFAVYRTSSKPDIDPGSLYVSNHSCAPVICTPDFAVFKIPLTGCGTHRFVIGETSVYLADVFGKRYKNHQMYGQILRHAPYHSQIECRYSKGTHASTGYMVVNSPALPDVVSSGALGVVLRIAKDDGYTTFFQDTQVPLKFLLGSKIYLEVKIVNPPTPEVVLLVHYCIAYPRSSENVWVLMYNGCPNALDYGTGLHLKDHNRQPVPKHTRRFDVTTFQFMDAKENLLDEEIYFMCSTEICSHKESCVEGCFDGRQMTIPQSEWERLCAGKPCPRQPRVKKAIADHGSLHWRDEPSSQEN